MYEVSEDEVRQRLRDKIIREWGTQRAAGKALGYSDAYLSAVLTGRVAIPKSLAEMAGARKTWVVDGLDCRGIKLDGLVDNEPRSLRDKLLGWRRNKVQ